MSAWAAHDGEARAFGRPRRQPPHRSAEAEGGAELARDIIGAMNACSPTSPGGDGGGAFRGEGRLPQVDSRSRRGRRRWRARPPPPMRRTGWRWRRRRPLGKRLRQRAAERHIGGDAGGFGSLSQLQFKSDAGRSVGGGRSAGRPAPAPAGAAVIAGRPPCPAPPPAAAPAAAARRGGARLAGGGGRRRRRRVCLCGDAMRAADAEGLGAPADADGPRAEPEAAGGDQSAARRGVFPRAPPCPTISTACSGTTRAARPTGCRCTPPSLSGSGRRVAPTKRQKLAKREEKLEEKPRKQRAKAKAAEKAAAEKQAAHFGEDKKLRE